MSVLFGVALSFADPIVVDIHAHWTPDLTAQQSQAVCVTSGTVAGADLHLIVNYSSPIFNFTITSVDIVEQTNAHTPWHYHANGPITPSPNSTPPSPQACSSPPTQYQLWILYTLTPPEMPFSFHNTSYVVTVNYSYLVPTGNYPPSPSNPMYRMVTGSISRTFNFQNLVVEAQPKLLIWDRSYPQNNDTTISYSLSSAQKKNCLVTIEIYPVDGANPIYTTQRSVLCPGSDTFVWNGTMNGSGVPPGTLAPTGVYTFDIKVQGACSADQDRMRSSNLTISNVAVNSLGLSTIRVGKFNLTYTLSDLNNIPPSNTAYSVVSPDFQHWQNGLASNLLGNNSQLVNNVNLETAGYHTFVVSSICNNLNNKSHSPHPALDKGVKFRVAPAVCFGFSGMTTHFNGDAAYAYNQLGKVMHPDMLSSCYSEVRPDPQTGERRGGVIIDGYAEQALRALHENAIFMFAGFGGPTSLDFGKSNDANDDFLLIWITNDQYTPPNSLSHVVFALFAACEAGQNFANAVVGKGAEAAIGFTMRINDWVASAWTRRFFKYATKSTKVEGETTSSIKSVALSAKCAYLDIKKHPFWKLFYKNAVQDLGNSMVIVGDTFLFPARKGKILR